MRKFSWMDTTEICDVCTTIYTTIHVGVSVVCVWGEHKKEGTDLTPHLLKNCHFPPFLLLLFSLNDFFL